MAKNKKRKLDPKTMPEAAKDPVAEDPKDDEEELKQQEEPPLDPEPPSYSAAGEPLDTDEPLADDELPIDQDQEEEEEEEEAPCITYQETQHSVPVDEAAAGAANDGGLEDEVEEENDPSSVQKILEPFTKELLLELLRDAAVKHPDVLGEIQQIADADPSNRKVFVHGLGWDTTRDSLKAVFLQYGEIEDCNVVIDKATGKSKGYAFILFKHRNGAHRALKQPQKKIGNRMTACQLASSGPVQPAQPAPPPVSEYTQRKIFVSNVGAEIDPQKLRQFFSQFGEIEEGPLGLDKATGKPRGFALFVYKTVESSKKALEEPHKKFEGHTLHCQKAIDGPKPHKMGYQFQASGGQHSVSHLSSVGAEVLSSRYPRNESSGFYGGVGNYVSTGGHLMAPPATGMGYNQAAQSTAPSLGQAFGAFLTTQGGGLGNLLGNLGSNGVGTAGLNTGVAASSGGAHGMHYGNQTPAVGGKPNIMGGYGAAGALQGGYANMIGQGGTGRNQSGLGYMGGVGPYM